MLRVLEAGEDADGQKTFIQGLHDVCADERFRDLFRVSEEVFVAIASPVSHSFPWLTHPLLGIGPEAVQYLS